MRLALLAAAFLFFSAPPVSAASRGEELFPELDPVLVAIQHERAGGSGVIISPDGYILTNGHVVSLMDPEQPRETARRITVILNDESKYQARVVGFGLDPDVALLKIDAPRPLRAARLAKGALRTGQTVFAFGAPFGLRRTLTQGIVSNPAQTSLDTFTSVIQTDALINPGNSGGPLFNEAGEVIGLNTYGGEGNGFAIPVEVARTLGEQYREHGRFRRAGLSFFVSKAMPENFARVLGTPQGIFVDFVLPGSEAARQGLKDGDVIVAMDGVAVKGASEEDYNDWHWDLVTRRPGSPLKLGLLRRSAGQPWRPLEISCVLGEDELLPALGHQLGELPETLYPEIGLGIQKVTPFVLHGFSLPGSDGVRVTTVSNGPAARADIRGDDLIVAIDGQPVKDDRDFRRLVDERLVKRARFLVFDLKRGNDQSRAVLRVPYRLRDTRVLILAAAGEAQRELFARRLRLAGAEVTVAEKGDAALAAAEWDAVLIAVDSTAVPPGAALFLDRPLPPGRNCVLGLSGKAPALLAAAGSSWKLKRLTADKEAAAPILKAGMNYTGREVEIDENLVTCTGFDSISAKAFLAAFADAMAKNR
ncbi:MAG: hypothetical protein RL095_2198 [Verrucomicrobiota bacterium]|jgi:serine protease Do